MQYIPWLVRQFKGYELLNLTAPFNSNELQNPMCALKQQDNNVFGL